MATMGPDDVQRTKNFLVGETDSGTSPGVTGLCKVGARRHMGGRAWV